MGRRRVLKRRYVWRDAGAGADADAGALVVWGTRQKGLNKRDVAARVPSSDDGAFFGHDG